MGLLALVIGCDVDVIVFAVFGHERHRRHHHHVVELLGHHRDLGRHARLQARVGRLDENVDVKGHAAAATVGASEFATDAIAVTVPGSRYRETRDT